MEKPNQIFVNGLPFDVKEKDIRMKFDKFGQIKNVFIKRNFCFIVRLIFFNFVLYRNMLMIFQSKKLSKT